MIQNLVLGTFTNGGCMLPHIIDASDRLLVELFKDKWGIARWWIEDYRKRINTGDISDDKSFSVHMMNRFDDMCQNEKISDILYQQEGSGIFHFTKRELSKMSVGYLNIIQRWINLERSVNYYYNKKIEERKKGDIKFAKTSIKTLTNQYAKLANLWNEIYADDVMTPEELRTFAEKVHKCRIYSDDFEDFEKFVYENVLTKGAISYEDSIKIYNYAIQILEVIKNRIEQKQNEEQQAKEQAQ